VDEGTQIERETNGEPGGGTAGVTSNTPNPGGNATSFSNLKEREDRNETRTETFEINERVINSVQNPGSIKRLTASLLVAKRFEMVDGERVPVQRTEQQMDELRVIVVTALGIQMGRGLKPQDYVTVKEMEF